MMGLGWYFFHGVRMEGVDSIGLVFLALWTEVSLVQHEVMAASSV